MRNEMEQKLADQKQTRDVAVHGQHFIVSKYQDGFFK